MATHKSTMVSNLQSYGSASAILKPEERGILRSGWVTYEVTTAMIDNADDLILFLTLPSDAILTSLVVYNDDLDSHATPTLACDVGLYYGSKSGTNAQDAVIDADLFGSAITTLQAANTLGVNIRFESAAGNIDDIGKPLWELGGLTSDPKVPLVIGLDITTAAATAEAGTISLVATYIRG